MAKTNKDMQKIRLTLDRIEEENAVLFDEENAKISLPRHFLPKDLREGSALVLTVATDEADTASREKKAKEILNEILRF